MEQSINWRTCSQIARIVGTPNVDQLNACCCLLSFTHGLPLVSNRLHIDLEQQGDEQVVTYHHGLSDEIVQSGWYPNRVASSQHSLDPQLEKIVTRLGAACRNPWTDEQAEQSWWRRAFLAMALTSNMLPLAKPGSIEFATPPNRMHYVMQVRVTVHTTMAGNWNRWRAMGHASQMRQINLADQHLQQAQQQLINYLTETRRQPCPA